MRTFCRQRLILLLSLGIAALMLSASGCSRNKADVSAEKFYSDALAAMRQERYDDAEHLLTASLALFQQTGNAEKFAEATDALAGLDRIRGKLSHAFGHYQSALAYYQSTQNSEHMISVMNAMADLYAFTGKRDSALIFSSLALHSSGLTGNADLQSASEFERGRIELMFNVPETAVSHFRAAAGLASASTSPLFRYELSLYHGAALTALGKQDEAIQNLLEAERYASSSGDARSSIRAKCALAAAYLHFGLYENAMQAVTAGVKIDAMAGSTGMSAQFLCGIGEVFLAHYAFGPARVYFTKALERAQIDEDTDVMGYCLVRLGDCDAQAAMPAPTGAAVMEAVSLYEQAYTLFENDAVPQRKAIVLVKEATLRAALHEDADADRLFKKAYELMRTTSVTGTIFQEPFRITSCLRLLPNNFYTDDWWYRPYTAFLLHKRRIGDALALATDGMAAAERSEFLQYPLAFQDTVRNQRIRSYTGHVRPAALAEYELLLQQTLGHKLVDEPENKLTEERYATMRDGLMNEGNEIAASYPSLLPLVTPPALSFETIQKRTTEDGSIVSFLSLDDRMYAVIVAQKSGPVAVDLGASAPIIEKVKEYCSLMRAHMKRATESREGNAALAQSSHRLAADLILPIERFLTKRVMVHATREIDGLPVHALLLPSGRPVSDSHVVTYVPFLGAMPVTNGQSPLKGVVIFGSPSARPIETEYGLRSIKNFYNDAAIIVTQSATEKNFLSASGGFLHFSTLYGTDDVTRRTTFALSGGSITTPDAYVPISFLLMARPFRVCLLADQRTDTCGTTAQTAAFALMSGATQVIVQRYPFPATYGKDFNEFFYTNLTTSGDAKKAYMETLMQMQRGQERDKVYSGAPFFFIEW
jgi:tetratricopeptide (TPR) repeat protein